MKAAVFLGPGQLELKDVDRPHAGSGQLILKVGANTVCGTDLRILKGEKTSGVGLNTIMGHELAGYVEEIGEGVEGYEIGDLVGVAPTVPCGRCDLCITGKEHLCDDAKLFGYAIDGGLAEYVLIDEKALARGAIVNATALTPEGREVEPVEIAMAEPLGAVLNGVNQYQPKLGDTVVVIGGGAIGLLHVQVNALIGASTIILSDPHETRRELARKFGATHTINGREEDIEEYVKKVTNGRGADVVVMAIGRPELAAQTIRLAKKGGHVNWFAGFPKGCEATVDPNLLHYSEIVLTGGSNMPGKDYELAVRLIATGQVDVKSLHTKTFPLSQVIEGIEFVGESRDSLKTAIIPD